MAQDAQLEKSLPPHDAEAERSVLGTMLRDNATVSEVVSLINGSSFYNYPNKVLFEAVVEIVVVRGQPADPVTVGDYLHNEGLVADIGGYGYIVELWDAAPATANVGRYAAIVRGYAIKRAIAHMARELESAALEKGADWSETLELAEKKIFALSAKCRSSQAVKFDVAVRSAIERIATRIDEFKSEAPPASSVKTGFASLDRILVSVDNGDVVLIAARPSVGKTAIAMNIACRMAAEGLPVYVASLEQGKEDIVDRVLAGYASVDSALIRLGKLDDYQQDKLHAAADTISRFPIVINDTPEQTVIDIIASMRRYKQQMGCRAAFIDYLQLIQPDDTRQVREQQVARMSRSLKLAAREIGIPIFVLAQVNRDSDKGDGRIKISQLRESGSLEQDADVILLLQGQGEDSLQMEVEVGKARKGKRGSVFLAFDKTTLRMTDWDKEETG